MAPRTAPVLSPAGPASQGIARPWIKIHHTGDAALVRLEPSPPRRRWCEPGALWCTPLIVANQLGWTVRNADGFWATWNGGQGKDATRVTGNPAAASHFGHGIVTVTVPYYLETSPGLALLVKAVPNYPIDGWCPLEGLVETDWFEGSFTLNFRLTRPNSPLYYAAGQPLVQLLPYPRDFAATVDLRLSEEAERAAWMDGVTVWNRDRARLLGEHERGEHDHRDGYYRDGKRHDGLPSGATPPVRRLRLASLRGQPQGEAW